MPIIPISEFATGKSVEEITEDIPYMEQATDTSGPEKLAPGVPESMTDGIVPIELIDQFNTKKESSNIIPLESISGFVKDDDGNDNPLIELPKQFAIGFANEALLGFPLWMLDDETEESLESDIPSGRVGRGLGTLTGFLVGLPGKVFSKGGALGIKGVSKLVRATSKAAKVKEAGKIAKGARSVIGGLIKTKTRRKLLKSAAKGAVGFGLYEAVKAPEEGFDEKLHTIPQSVFFGAVLNVGIDSIKPIIKHQIDFLRKNPEFINTVKTFKESNFYRNDLFTSARTMLWNQGKPGRALQLMIDTSKYLSQTRTGAAIINYYKQRGWKRKFGFTRKEMLNFTSVIQGTPGSRIPMNDKVDKVVKYWRKMANEMGIEWGMLKKDAESKFFTLPNYFPHFTVPVDASKEMVDDMIAGAVARQQFVTEAKARRAWKAYQSLITGKGNKEPLYDWIVKTGQAKNSKEAAEKMKEYIARRQEPRFGPFDYHRNEISLPFYDINPDRVIPQYFHGGYRRMEQFKMFGAPTEAYPEGKRVGKLLNRISAKDGDGDMARKVFRREAGINTEESTSKLWGFMKPLHAQKIRNFEVITKLGLAAVPNSSQSLLTAIRTSLKSTGKAIKMAFKDAQGSEEYAMRVGVVNEALLRDITSAATGGTSNWARNVLKYSGFSFIEKWNRIIAANAGKYYAEEIAGKLIKDPSNKRYFRQLFELNLNPKKILKEGGVAIEDLMRASDHVVNTTQFKSGALDLPLFFTSPEGKLLTQFKNYVFNYTKFMKDIVLGEARRGNYAPLTKAVVLMPILGEGVKDIRGVLAGKPRTEQGLVRLAENYGAIGGVGIVYDLIKASTYGRTADFFMGPGLSDVFQLIQNTTKTFKGQPQQLQKQLIKNIPTVGPLLKNQMIK